MRLLRTALANRALARVLAVWALRQLGTWAFTILLSLEAYEQGGAVAVAAIFAIRTLPGALVAPYTAMLADRHSRRAVLLAAATGRGLVVAGAGVAVMAGAPLAVVFVLAALFEMSGIAHEPAQGALLPGLARTPAELAAANACLSTIEYGALLAGSVLAGTAAATVGVDVAMLATAAPFALAVLLLLTVPADARPELLPGEEPEPPLAQLLGGVHAVRGDTRLQVLTSLFAADMLVQGIFDVLVVLAALELLGMGQDGVGLLNGAWGLGGLAGGIAAVALVARGHLARGLVLACVVAGVPLALVGVVDEPGVVLALLAVLGAGLAIAEVGLDTFTQRLVAEDAVARVVGLQKTLEVTMSALGAGIAAVLVRAVGLEAAIVATGVVLPVVALALSRPLLRLETAVEVPERAFALLRAVPLFAPLPVATVETLAVRSQSLDLAPGMPIIAEGTDGDRFYVIDQGSLEVTIAGRHVRVQREGEFFGEIALLQRTARTATIRALDAVRLLAIDREDFLAGIGAHTRSTHAAGLVATERLEYAAAA